MAFKGKLAMLQEQYRDQTTASLAGDLPQDAPAVQAFSVNSHTTKAA